MATINQVDVDRILSEVDKKEELLKSISVEKELPLDFDLGNLMAIDNNVLDMNTFRTDKENYLHKLAREDTQLIVNAVWDLKTEQHDGLTYAVLPYISSIIPREKPVPVKKPPTKWELFAKEKGIKNKKKPKLVWDEYLKKWLPRYGYKKAQAEHNKDWIIEVPNSVDPMTDMFAKKSFDKNERVAKNELQRLGNIARANKVKVPEFGLATRDDPSTNQLEKATSTARKATASHGVFQRKLPKEKVAKQKKGKKKIVQTSMEKERQHNLEIFERLTRKEPQLDLNKAVNRQIHDEQSQAARSKKDKKPKRIDGKKRTVFHASKKPGEKGAGNKGKKARQSIGKKKKQ